MKNKEFYLKQNLDFKRLINKRSQYRLYSK